MSRDTLVAALYCIVGFINFVPFVGFAGQAQLEHMYAVTICSSELALLMQHRAVLLAIVGALLLAATVHKHLRRAAAIAAFASMGSFVVVIESSDVSGTKLDTVSVIDMAAMVLLLIAVVLGARDRDTIPNGEVKG